MVCARRSNARTRAAQYPDFRGRRSADALERLFATALLVYRQYEPFDHAVSVGGPRISAKGARTGWDCAATRLVYRDATG